MFSMSDLVKIGEFIRVKTKNIIINDHLDFDNNRINNLGAPILASDAARLYDAKYNTSWLRTVDGFIDFTTAEPPAPANGDRHINTVNGFSSVTGQAVLAECVYEWDTAAVTWAETVPQENWCVADNISDAVYRFDGITWFYFGGLLFHSNLQQLPWSVAGHTIDTDMDMLGFNIIGANIVNTATMNVKIIDSSTNITFNKEVINTQNVTHNGNVINNQTVNSGGSAIYNLPGAVFNQVINKIELTKIIHSDKDIETDKNLKVTQNATINGDVETLNMTATNVLNVGVPGLDGIVIDKDGNFTIYTGSSALFDVDKVSGDILFGNNDMVMTSAGLENNVGSVIIDPAGSIDHALLDHLTFAASNHTGFQKEIVPVLAGDIITYNGADWVPSANIYLDGTLTNVYVVNTLYVTSINAGVGNDLNLIMGDASGVNSVVFCDSGSVPVVYFDSNGNLIFVNSAIISTLAGYIQIMPVAGQYTRIGAGATSHSLNTNNDLLVSGRLEVNGLCFFDAPSIQQSYFRVVDDAYLALGNSNDARFVYSTHNTPHSLILGLPVSSRGWVICERGDESIDFAHPLQTNPTIFLQSADGSDITQWISFTHDQTDGLIKTGKGDLKLSPVGNINANTNKITNVVDPVAPQDAATQNYVDTTIISAVTVSVVNKAANYTANINEHVRTDATTGIKIITLPTAAGHIGLKISVKKVDASGNKVTVAAQGGQTIDGVASVDLVTQNDVYTFLSVSATAWDIV